jgi:hypothetical protein
MLRFIKQWLAVAMLSLSVVPAMAFDDAAFCQLLTKFAKTTADKQVASEPLTTNDAILVDCDRKTVEFKRSVALSYSELNPAWQASKQREWNSEYCRNAEWAPIFESGWQVSMTVRTFDGKRVTFFAECIR